MIFESFKGSRKSECHMQVNKQRNELPELPIMMEQQTAAMYWQRMELRCKIPVGIIHRVVWAMKAKKVIPIGIARAERVIITVFRQSTHIAIEIVNASLTLAIKFDLLLDCVT